MSDVNLLQSLRDLVNSEKLTEDWEKTLKGNKQAGTRVRGLMQDLRAAAKSVRDEVMTIRKKTASEKAAAKAKAN